MTQLPIVLGFLSAIFALAAAGLWLVSARVKTPDTFSIQVTRAHGMMGEPLGGDPLGGTYIGSAYSQDLVDLANALRRQSRFSAWAAVAAAIAAALQAGALVMQVLSSAG